MLEAIDLSKNLQEYYGSRCPESYDRARDLLPLGTQRYREILMLTWSEPILNTCTTETSAHLVTGCPDEGFLIGDQPTPVKR